MSISVSNITKIYGEQRALSDVSFEVSTGEIVGFLGPNGAGKSTMMKILTTFIPQTEGTARICGYDVAEDSLEVRRRFGYLPEHNPLYLDMYVKEYLEFIGGLHKLAGLEKRIGEMIEMTGLQVEQKKKIGALSKGYRQRVGLAQALIHDPEVLILDEPTTGLDPNQLEEIRNLIRRVGKSKTVMLSTHIMQEVEAVCDRVIIISKGTIVANDQTATLQQSGNRYVIVVEFDKPVSRNSLRGITHVQDARELRTNVWALEVHGEEDIRAEVFQFALRSGLAVLTLNREEQRLEEVFKKLTR